MRVNYKLNGEMLHHSYDPYFLPCVGEEVKLDKSWYKVKSRLFDIEDKVVTLNLEI